MALQTTLREHPRSWPHPARDAGTADSRSPPARHPPASPLPSAFDHASRSDGQDRVRTVHFVTLSRTLLILRQCHGEVSTCVKLEIYIVKLTMYMRVQGRHRRNQELPCIPVQASEMTSRQDRELDPVLQLSHLSTAESSSSVSSSKWTAGSAGLEPSQHVADTFRCAAHGRR